VCETGERKSWNARQSSVSAEFVLRIVFYSVRGHDRCYIRRSYAI
jgi:hypothetical protein